MSSGIRQYLLPVHPDLSAIDPKHTIHLAMGSEQRTETMHECNRQIGKLVPCRNAAKDTRLVFDYVEIETPTSLFSKGTPSHTTRRRPRLVFDYAEIEIPALRPRPAKRQRLENPPDSDSASDSDSDSDPEWATSLRKTTMSRRVKARKRGKKKPFERTVVLPLAYEFFAPLFEDPDEYFERVEIQGSPRRPISTSESPTASPSPYEFATLKGHSTARLLDPRPNPPDVSADETHFRAVSIDGITIRIGECVELYPSNHENGPWSKKDASRWIGMVKQVFKGSILKHVRSKPYFVRLVWLYGPSHTVVREAAELMDQRELFWTDNCDCDQTNPNCQPIEIIKRKIQVRFGQTSCSGPHEFHCTRRFEGWRDCSPTGAFVDLRLPNDIHLTDGTPRCACTTDTPSNQFRTLVQTIRPSDVLLMRAQPKETLYTIYTVEDVSKLGGTITLRRWERLRNVEGGGWRTGRQNELVYTETKIVMLEGWGEAGGGVDRAVRAIGRAIEFVDPKETVLPVHLRHNGAGDRYFFRKTIDPTTNKVLPVTETQARNFASQYPPFMPSPTKLNALDLCCGGGSLGRGVMDAGLVECRWAVDNDSDALGTYITNTSKNRIEFIKESINAVLKGVANRQLEERLRASDNVELLLVGCPCQAFCRSNRRKNRKKYILQGSLVAGALSFLELYRHQSPDLLFENVPEICTAQLDVKGRTLFSHLVAYILALGYQVRWEILTAANFGVAQDRRRLFLWASASGKTLPEMPLISHHRNGSAKRNKEASQATDGRVWKSRIGELRDYEVATFPLLTAEEIIGDLPDIGNGSSVDAASCRLQHFVAKQYGSQSIIDRIPVEPERCSLKHLKDEVLNKSYIPESFARVARTGPFPTITGHIGPRAFQSRALHYAQNRVLTVRECARAQGFLDEEYIFGRSELSQRIVVGNAVPRPLAFALGLELRKARTNDVTSPSRTDPDLDGSTTPANPADESVKFAKLDDRGARTQCVLTIDKDKKVEN